MSNKIRVEFEMLDPDHTNEELILWARKLLAVYGIYHVNVWIDVPETEEEKKKLKEQIENIRLRQKAKQDKK